MDNVKLQWWVATLMGAFIFLLAGWRGGWVEEFDLMTVLGAVLVVVTLYSLRERAMRLTARLQGLSVRPRVWEAAFPLSLCGALILGLFLPTPGSIYPQGGTWRYWDLVPKVGRAAFAGALAVLAFAWAMWMLLRFGRPPPEIASWLHFAYIGGQMLAVVEVLLPFSIFVSFNGRRVWDWSRLAWVVLALATLGLFLARG